jgi:hypothetical protein
MDSRTPSTYPASLLKGGKNSLAVHFKMIPLNWNPASLKTTVLEGSYFEIPEADHWIGMADLKDFTSSAFPFSIYPDLQDTHFLLTDNNISTIESVMQIARFLGESVKYPPYYLTIGRELDNSVENKNVIMVGSYNEDFEEIYRSAPLILAKQGYIRDIDLSNKFAEEIEDIEEMDIDETDEQRENFIRLFETAESSRYLVTQFFQSPYDGDKTILMFNGQDISLKDEVKQILDPKFREKIKGDLVISKLTSTENREVFNFDIQDPYFIGRISEISKIYRLIGENPLLFVIISVILIILAVYLLRKTLILYRTRYHESDASAID